MSVLSAQQIEQFHDRGFVLLERGFGEPLAAEQRESIWRELCDGYGLDCLLGSWEALGPEHWGSVLFTFPNADTCNVLRKTWRWDNPITPHREGCAAVWMFSFLAPMRPGGGVTVIVEGTHRE